MFESGGPCPSAGVPRLDWVPGAVRAEDRALGHPSGTGWRSAGQRSAAGWGLGTLLRACGWGWGATSLRVAHTAPLGSRVPEPGLRCTRGVPLATGATGSVLGGVTGRESLPGRGWGVSCLRAQGSPRGWVSWAVAGCASCSPRWGSGGSWASVCWGGSLPCVAAGPCPGAWPVGLAFPTASVLATTSVSAPAHCMSERRAGPAFLVGARGVGGRQAALHLGGARRLVGTVTEAPSEAARAFPASLTDARGGPPSPG